MGDLRRQSRSARRRKLSAIGLSLAASGAGVSATAAPAPQTAQPSAAVAPEALPYRISAGPLDGVLAEYSRVSGVKVTLADPRIGNVQSPGASGTLTSAAALDALLKGTGVRAARTSAGYELRVENILQSLAVTAQADRLESPKYTEPLVDTPQTVVVIPQQVFLEQNAASLRDVLRNTPGITMSIGEGGSGGTSSGDNVLIRGFSARNDIFLDGARDPGLTNRDAFDLETVEVAKGPASATGGRGTTGGSINLVTKAPELQNFGTIRFTGGNGDYKRTTLDVNQRLKPTIGFRLNGMWQDTGYPGRDVAKYRSWGVAPSLTLGLGKPTTLTFSVDRTQQDNIPDWGLPALLPDVAIAQGVTVNNLNFSNFYGIASRDYEFTRADHVTVLFTHKFAEETSLRILTRYGRNYRDAVLTPPRPATTTTGQGPEDPGYNPTVAQIRRTDTKYQHRNDQIFINQSDFSHDFDTGPIHHDSDIGMELSRDFQPTYAFTDLFTYGRPPVDDLFNPTPYASYTPAYGRTGATSDAHATTSAFYGFDTLKFGKHWVANVGLRWDRVAADYLATAATATGVPGVQTRFAHTDKVLTGRAGIVYKPTARGSIYAAASNSFTPSFDGTLGLTLAATGVNNQALAPEKTRNVEIGTKWELARSLLITAGVFDIEKTNAKTTDASGATVLAGDQRVKGAELDISGSINSRWTAFGGFSLMNGKVKASDVSYEVDAPLAYVPHTDLNLWSTYRVSSRLTVGGGVTYTSGQYFNQTGGFSYINNRYDPRYVANAAAIQALSKYWLYNLSAMYTVNRHLTIQVNGLNLNNARYEDRGYDRHFLPGPTRQVLAGPVISW